VTGEIDLPRKVKMQSAANGACIQMEKFGGGSIMRVYMRHERKTSNVEGGLKKRVSPTDEGKVAEF